MSSPSQICCWFFSAILRKQKKRGISEGSRRVSKLLTLRVLGIRSFPVRKYHTISINSLPATNTLRKKQKTCNFFIIEQYIYQWICTFCLKVVPVGFNKKNSVIMYLASYFLVLEFTVTNAVPKAFDSSRLGQYFAIYLLK